MTVHGDARSNERVFPAASEVDRQDDQEPFLAAVHSDGPAMAPELKEENQSPGIFVGHGLRRSTDETD